MSQGMFNKFGTKNHGFKATTLAPVNQKIRVQRAGLTCKAMPVLYYCPTVALFNNCWNNSPRRFSAGVLNANGLRERSPIG
jgi:hypothetical protein